MIQYIILGYLVFEILRLAQMPDVSEAKFTAPQPAPSEQPAPSAQPVQSAPPSAPEPPKSETATAKSD